MSQDPVENAPLPKELKGEEGNSSDIKSQDLDDTEAFDKEFFRLFCQVFVRKYDSNSEEQLRFKYFKDSLNREVSPSMMQGASNRVDFADRSEEEMKALPFSNVYCSISRTDLTRLQELDSFLRKREDEFSGCSS